MKKDTLNMKNYRILIYLAVLLLAFIWGNAFVAIKYALNYITPAQLLIFRFVPTLLFFLVIIILRRGYRMLRKLSGMERLRLLILALAGIPGYNFALNWGEQRITAGMASLIIALNPGMVFIFTMIFLKQRNHVLRKILGLLLAFSGLAYLVYSTQQIIGDPSAGSIWIGALVTLCSPLCWAIYTLTGKPLVEKYSSLEVTAWVTILGTLPILFLIRPSTFAGISDFPVAFWIAIAWLVLFCTIIGFAVWFWALKRMGATELSAFIYLIPAFSIFFGRLLLNEPITLPLLIGGFVLLTGIYLCQSQPKKVA